MAIIGHVGNNQTSIKGTKVHNSSIDSGLPGERTLIWSMSDSGSTRSPSYESWGSMTSGMTGIHYVQKANWPHNGKGWARLIFTSKNHPYRQWAIANHTMNNYGNYANIERLIDTLFSDADVWGSGNTMSQNGKYNIRLCCGSMGRIGTDNCIVEHNAGSTENHDIPCIGEDNGNHVWSDGIIWGNIDNTSNYGGLGNWISPVTSGGSTGDTLEIYYESYYPKQNDYVDFLNSSESTDRPTTMTWTESTSGGSGGSLVYIARANDRFTTENWSNHGRQHGGMGNGDSWMQVDLGAENAQIFDFSFVIGYPSRSHDCDNNYIKASNDNSNWVTMAEWKHHPAGGSGTNTSAPGSGAGTVDDGYPGGYLFFREGAHCYTNTRNNVEKWIPLRKTTTAYRYWRVGGTNWSNKGNGYQLIMNWALLKRKDVIDARGSWQQPFRSLQDADDAGVPDGHYWFINTLGYKEHCYIAMFEDGQGTPANSGSRWMLVSSNNGCSRRIPNGTSRNNNAYRLGCNGSWQYGVANPDSDYIIGHFIEDYQFAHAKIYGFGYNEGAYSGTQNNHSPAFKVNDREWLSVTWRPSTGNRNHTNGTYYPNPLGSRTSTNDCQKHTSWPNGMYNFSYAVVDSVRMDSGLNANSNQSTIGGSGNASGDPSGGCHIGHGTNESGNYCEGWYAGDSVARDSQGYTTWVR